MATIENFATVRYTSNGTALTRVSNVAEIGLASSVTFSKVSLGDEYTADGTVTFDAIDYAAAGTYTYAVSEAVPAGAHDNGDGTFTGTDGIIYDGATHTVTVTVTDDSYGIEVAQLAGVPKEIVNRAKKILAELEADDTKVRYTPNVSPVEEEPLMPTLFDSAKDDFIREVAAVDVNTLTPIEAMSKLFELAKKAKEI